MSTKEALKPKIGASKKDEKRKAKKEKLTQELAAKEEAKEEARRQEEEERIAAQQEQQYEMSRGQATMGNKFAQLISQISQQNAQKQASDPRRSNKKKASDAIKNAKFLLKSDAFQMDPISAMGSVTSELQRKLENEN